MARPASASFFSKPGFCTWLAIIALALLTCSKFLPSLILAFILAVICRPLYEAIHRILNSPKFLKRHPAVAQGLASVLTQVSAYFFVLIGVLAPLFVLSLNRDMIVSSAQGAYAQAREWSRTEIQSVGERIHIKEWTAFKEFPAPDSGAHGPAPGIQEPQNAPSRLVEFVSRPGPFVPSLLKMLGGGAMLLGQTMFFSMALHFLLLYGPKFWRDMLIRSPSAWRPTLASLGGRARTVVMATCLVHGLTAVSAFLLALPIFWIIVGTKYFVLAAMLAGICQFVPLVGSATLVSLMTVYFFSTGAARQGCECVFLAFPFIVGMPDIFIRPYLAARFGKMLALTMFIGFIVGLSVFGPLGFILGPLLLDLIIQFTKQVRGGRQLPRESLPLKP